MLLSTHKEKTDELDLIKYVAHDFCEGNKDRFSSFGVFTEYFPTLSPILWINFIKVQKI